MLLKKKMNKGRVHFAVLQEIESRIKDLKLILDDAFAAAGSSDAKSSAGDKHETGVAMAQLEQEKLTKQINELLTLQGNLLKINPTIVHQKIKLGSLVETNNGWFYFSIGIGFIKVEELTFFAINPRAPLGQLLVGKGIGDSITFNGNTTTILSVQ